MAELSHSELFDRLEQVRQDYMKLDGRHQELKADNLRMRDELVRIRDKMAEVFTAAKDENDRLKQTVSDLHSVLTEEQWAELEDKTRHIAMLVHEELHHG